MSVNIVYENIKAKKPISNFIFFIDDKYNLSNIKKNISNKEFSYVNDLIKNIDNKKKNILF